MKSFVFLRPALQIGFYFVFVIAGFIHFIPPKIFFLHFNILPVNLSIISVKTVPELYL